LGRKTIRAKDAELIGKLIEATHGGVPLARVSSRHLASAEIAARSRSMHQAAASSGDPGFGEDAAEETAVSDSLCTYRHDRWEQCERPFSRPLPSATPDPLSTYR